MTDSDFGDAPPPVRLGLVLQMARAKDCDLAGAWSVAVRIALHGVDEHERETWERILAEQRDSWFKAYTRQRPPEEERPVPPLVGATHRDSGRRHGADELPSWAGPSRGYR